MKEQLQCDGTFTLVTVGGKRWELLNCVWDSRMKFDFVPRPVSEEEKEK